MEGRPKEDESTSVKLGQNDQDNGETRNRLAKEHGVSPKTVQRSADLYKAHKAIGEVAPEVAMEFSSMTLYELS